MEQSIAQTLAEQYVERVNSVEDIADANAWVQQEAKDLDESVVVEAGEIAARMLVEKGVVPVSTPEEAVEAPVEAYGEVSAETTTDVQGEDTQSENA